MPQKAVVNQEAYNKQVEKDNDALKLTMTRNKQLMKVNLLSTTSKGRTSKQGLKAENLM